MCPVNSIWLFPSIPASVFLFTIPVSLWLFYPFPRKISTGILHKSPNFFLCIFPYWQLFHRFRPPEPPCPRSTVVFLEYSHFRLYNDSINHRPPFFYISGRFCCRVLWFWYWRFLILKIFDIEDFNIEDFWYYIFLMLNVLMLSVLIQKVLILDVLISDILI